jgi:glycosyltransferase involved in cell wall biosynthesis
MLVPDLRKLHWQGVATVAAPAFDLIVSLDGCRLETLPGLILADDRFLRGWTPVSEFEPLPYEQRSLGVNMVGSLWGPRVAAVRRLQSAGIEVTTRPDQESASREDRLPAHKTLSNAAYIDLLRRSCITVNLSACSTGDGDQVKGRVFEAVACGSMLLESANDVTCDFFEQGEEFVYFSDLDDLVAKVRHFLAHPLEAAAIAAAARQRFLRDYAAPKFWQSVYRKAQAANQMGQRRRQRWRGSVIEGKR